MKVGIIGLGTVGEGVLKVLTLEKENIKIKSNCELEVKYACDLNVDRQFSFDFDKNILITDYNKIINDPEVDIVYDTILKTRQIGRVNGIITQLITGIVNSHRQREKVIRPFQLFGQTYRSTRCRNIS